MIKINRKVLLVLSISVVAAVVSIAIVALVYFRSFPTPFTENPYTLTREKAARMILEKIIGKEVSIWFDFDSYENAYNYNPFTQMEQMEKLEKEGFIRLLTGEELKSGFAWPYYFLLTDKAKPFILEISRDPSGGVRILLAKVTSVEVTGLTAPAEMFGRKVIVAPFIAKRELTPIGKIFNIPETEKGEAVFTLFDDGWRLTEIYPLSP